MLANPYKPGSLSQHSTALVAVIGLHGLLIWWLLAKPSEPLAPIEPPAVLTATLISATPAPNVATPTVTPRPVVPPQPSRPAVTQPQTTLSQQPARYTPLPDLTPTTVTPTPNPVIQDTPSPIVAAPAPVIAPAPPAPPPPTPAPEPVLEAPRFDAAYLNNPQPAYPLLAQRLGQQGRVLLRVLVSSNGKAQEVEVLESSGVSSLDQAAKKTVRDSWSFVPAKRGNEAVEAWVKVPINFKL